MTIDSTGGGWYAFMESSDSAKSHKALTIRCCRCVTELKWGVVDLLEGVDKVRFVGEH